eukprot:TRINITY_DN2840_c0_g1_i1.p1 TRINITY_DN2840_c0_g1~~TRINITY_DN2840_c0_g1_i1.p1  ORF type:complete len:734 (+),score=151.16 TRINITY_DN2840_c0_g1_i1:201-2402(+)
MASNGENAPLKENGLTIPGCMGHNDSTESAPPIRIIQSEEEDEVKQVVSVFSDHDHEGYQIDRDKVKEVVRQTLHKPQYSVHDFYWHTGLWALIAKNPAFEYTTLGVITVNAIWMSIDTDNNPAESLLEAQPIFQIAEQGFCVYFTFEWFVRWKSFRRSQDCFKDFWFVFDSCLVFFMVAETWVMTSLMASGVLGGGGGVGGTGILRLFRLLRLSRMARMLRSMPELMIMIKGMLAAFRSVFFTLCLLLIIMYIFAIMFTQLAKETPLAIKYFPSITYSMYTLLISGTFLDNIGAVCNDLGEQGGLSMQFIMFLFILMSALTVMNMLIGVLCEVVSAVAATEKEDMLMTFIQSKMREIVAEIDENGDCTISKEEFEKVILKPEAIAALVEVGVDPMGLVDFADYIFEDAGDVDGLERDLSLDEFLDVILQFRGSNASTVKDMIDMRAFLNDRFKILEDRLTGLKPLRNSIAPGAKGLDRTTSTDGISSTSSLKLRSADSPPAPPTCGFDLPNPPGANSPRSGCAVAIRTARRLESCMRSVESELQTIQKSVSASTGVNGTGTYSLNGGSGGSPGSPTVQAAARKRCSFEGDEEESSLQHAAKRLEEFVEDSLQACQGLRHALPLGIRCEKTEDLSKKRDDFDSSKGPEMSSDLARDLRLFLNRLEDLMLSYSDRTVRLCKTLEAAGKSPTKSPASTTGNGSSKDFVKSFAEELTEGLGALQTLRKRLNSSCPK